MVYSSYNDFDNEINIDLDVSTEVSHSILDILEEIHNIHSKTDQWHYEFSLILVELVLTNQCSICSILRGLKLFRNVIFDTFGHIFEYFTTRSLLHEDTITNGEEIMT